MSISCFTTQENKEPHPVKTDFYAPSQANSADAFDPWEIQNDIDKYVQWELEYYDWANHEGAEEDRPPRPGRHPDPKHEWNTNPDKMEMAKMDDIDVETAYDTDPFKSPYNSGIRLQESDDSPDGSKLSDIWRILLSQIEQNVKWNLIIILIFCLQEYY